MTLGPRQPVYSKTRDALAAYFDAPTSANADLVRQAFDVEAPPHASARGRTVDEIWDMVRDMSQKSERSQT